MSVVNMIYEYDAKIINVVDGDTIDCVVSLPFYLTATHRFRLLGVNCPEVHGDTKAAGLEAAAYTRATLLGQTVRIRTAKSDSFGRWLAQVFLGDVDFNQSLIDRGLAVPYMVGKFAGPGAAAAPEPELLSEPWHERLVFDFDVSEDSPVVRGTWCTVKHIISLIVDGWTWSDVLRTHPELTTDDIRTCLSYAVAEEKGDTGDAEPSSEKGSG
jgi:micrococcal nuclease